jgi:hypothetical protein
MNPADATRDFKDAKFVSITIKNESAAPAGYRFSFPDLIVAVHLLDKSTLFSQPKIKLALNWSISQTKRIGDQAVMLAAGETVIFEAKIATDLHCYSWNFGENPVAPTDPTMVGISYVFEGQKLISQIVNFDPATVAVEERVSDQAVPTEGMSGWIPAPLSQNLHTKFNASEVVRPRGQYIEQGCFTGPVPSL